MSASKSATNDKKDKILIKCDHKADVQRLEAEDKRITEAEPVCYHTCEVIIYPYINLRSSFFAETLGTIIQKIRKLGPREI